MNDVDFDLVVIGGGGAGLAAARAAAEGGARVIVLEAGDQVGGSTALSGGVFYAAGSSVQATAGIEDSPDAFYRYVTILNQFSFEVSLVRRLADEAAPTLEWLRELGVTFSSDQLYAAGLDGALRGHRATGLGREIIEVLHGAGAEAGAEVVLRSAVTGLKHLKEHDMFAVEIDGHVLTASSVVLATGGFAANPEKLARYYPEVAIYGEAVWSPGSPLCRGDGIDLGLGVGAELAGYNTGSTLLTPGFSRDFEPYLPGWLVTVGRDGRRFYNEGSDYSVPPPLVRKLPGGECFALFDEATREVAKAETSTKDQKRAYPTVSWTGDRLTEMIAAGRIAHAPTITDLAKTVGIDAPSLLTTVEAYNVACERGRDDVLFKPASLLRPLRSPPFYAVRLRPIIVGHTGTGVRIDTQARVLDKAGRFIPGLYAAGEAAAGIQGERYIGGGASIAAAVTFGRIAGRSAAERTAAIRETGRTSPN